MSAPKANSLELMNDNWVYCPVSTTITREAWLFVIEERTSKALVVDCVINLRHVPTWFGTLRS